MAKDPRTFTVKNCGNKPPIQNTRKKDFFSSIGKIGDLEILNDIGAGKFGRAARDLAKLGVVIGSGNGQLPSIVGSSAEAGANWVLDSLGIGANEAKFAEDFNPAVANRAYGAARQLYERIKNGSISSIGDVAGLLRDIKNFEQLANGIYTPPVAQAPRDFEVCSPSPYAVDLIARHPKYKYLFVVEFKFNTPYKPMADLEFTFVVKQTERPTVRFDYEEVNMYNFRTKVLKRMEYNPITMRFYDDNYNHIMRFYNTYLKAISPLSNLKTEYNTKTLEENAMGFDHLEEQEILGLSEVIKSHGYSAGTGPLLNNEKTVLKQIRLLHIYREGTLMNVYDFFNPKIEELQLDDLDMAEGGTGNEISLQMSYDALNIATGVSTDIGGQNDDLSFDGNINIENRTKGGLYPLKAPGVSRTDYHDPLGASSKAALEAKLNSNWINPDTGSVFQDQLYRTQASTQLGEPKNTNTTANITTPPDNLSEFLPGNDDEEI